MPRLGVLWSSYIIFLLLGVLITHTQSAIATPLTLKAALALVKKEKLTLPRPGADGTLHTLNKKGVTSSENIDAISQNFLEEIDADDKVALEIGPAFGHVVLKAFAGGVKSYTACDLDKGHLALIAEQVKRKFPKAVKKLKLLQGDFPKDYKHLPSNHFDAILLAKVIHFYSPDQTTHALKEIFRLLKPGGRLFIVAITPYVKRFEIFIPLYKQRLLLNQRYPGYVRNLKYFANPEVTSPKQMAQMHDKHFMFFDAQLMHRVLSEVSFIVEKAFEFPLGFKSTTWELDGREFVGAVARKPRARLPFPQS